MDLEAISYLKINHLSIFKSEMSENENSARPRCDFIYTKNPARPRSDFIYTKNFQEGRCDRKLRFYNKETAFAGYKIWV